MRAARLSDLEPRLGEGSTNHERRAGEGAGEGEVRGRTMGLAEVLLQLGIVVVVHERVGVGALADVARVVLALHVRVQRAVVVEPLPAEAAHRVALIPALP